jgi:hypothetical protein
MDLGGVDRSAAASFAGRTNPSTLSPSSPTGDLHPAA